MEISYICPCDKQTLKLLMLTAKDNVKAYNDIIDMQNKLYNEVYLRNTLIAKTLLGKNKELVIKPKDLHIWAYDGDTEKHFANVEYIKITTNEDDIIIFDIITENNTSVALDDLDIDFEIDLNSVLESCVKELFNKVSK